MSNFPNSQPPSGLQPPLSQGQSSEKSISPVGPEHLPAYPNSSMPGYGPWDGPSEGGFDIRQLVAMLMRRWKLILATLLFVVSLTVYVTWTTRRIYQAQATVLLNISSNRDAGGQDLPVLSDMLQASQTRSLDTQVEVLKSNAVYEGALKRLSAQDQKMVSEYTDIVVTPVRNTVIVSVVVKSYYPQASATFANALCAEYIQQSQNQNREQVHAATNYVQVQLHTVQGRLNQARTALRHFKEQNHTVDLAAESTRRVEQLGEAESALEAARSADASNAAQLRGLRAMAAKIAPIEKIPSSIVRRPAAESIKAEITKLELERIDDLQVFTPTSTKITDLDKRIAALRRQLRKEAQTEVAEWQPNPLRTQVTQDITKLQSEVWATEARAAALEQSAQKAKAEIAVLPAKEQQLSQLAMNVASQQHTYEMLSEKYQNLRISEQAHLANAQTLSAARTPGAPISPNKRRSVMSAVFIGLILALIVASLVDRIDDRLHSDAEVEQTVRLPVLAHVPYLKEKDQHYLLDQLEKKHLNTLLHETFQMLRTNISFSELDQPIRSVVVTSSLPGEGKTTSSINLAIAAALSGEQVILVDCDLRRPSLHRIFGLPNKVGLANVVAGQASLVEALQETKIPRLRVLTSGPVPPNPLLLLKSTAGLNVLKQIKEQAEFIVLDVPPALALADALVVATAADAIALVVSCTEANKREIVRTRDLLSHTGTLLIGVIFNKVQAGFGGDYYGYKYKYYDSYLNAASRNGTGNDASTIPDKALGDAEVPNDAGHSQPTK